MNDDAALDVLRDAADELADTATRDLGRDVASYQGWSVADLVVHTGRIHRWVTEIVRIRATRRLAQPDVWLEAAPADLWLFLMGRARRDVLAVQGPEHGVDRLERAVAMLPGHRADG